MSERSPRHEEPHLQEAHQAVELIQLATRLASATSVADVVTAIVHGGHVAMRADTVSVYLLDGTGSLLRLAGEAGMDARIRHGFAAIPVEAPLPGGEALRTRELVCYTTRAERDTRYAPLEGHHGAGTVIVAPMLGDDGPLGVLSVGWQEEHRITAQVEALATAVADLCSRTVLRAREHDIAQRTLRGQRILAEASRAFEDSRDPGATLRSVADMTVPAIADACVVCRLDGRGDLRPVVAVTDDDDRREIIDQLIARQSIITNPMLLDVVSTGATAHEQVLDRRQDEAAAEDAAHLRLIRALDATSMIAVPMIGAERIFGLLLFLVVGDRAPLGEESVTVLEALASRAAAAIDHADAYATMDRRIGHLEEALASRIVIEQAKGMLAVRWGISPEAAQLHMRHAARTRRLRMHDLAADVRRGTDDLPRPDVG